MREFAGQLCHIFGRYDARKLIRQELASFEMQTTRISVKMSRTGSVTIPTHRSQSMSDDDNPYAAPLPLRPEPQRDLPVAATVHPNSVPQFTIADLIFVGFNGYATALHRDTGEIVWSNNQLRSGFVTLLLDGDRLIVSTNGYMFCLDPLTGAILWRNDMVGYGLGATSLVSVRSQLSHVLAQQASSQAQQSAN
jgi:hypothetical protein